MTLPLLTHTVELARLEDQVRLWYLTDTHLGARGADEAALTATVDQIKADPAALWIAGGDKCEFIDIRDPRFDAAECASWVTVPDLADLAQCQARRYLELTKPIWDRCLGSLDGNHEYAVYKHNHFDVGAVVAAEMGVPHCRDGFWLRLNCTWPGVRKMAHALNIVAHHGWGGGRSAGSKANTLVQALAAFAADLVLLGHTHVRGREPAMTYTATRTDVLVRKRVALFGGTFLAHSGYALQRGYKPAEVGAVCATLHPWRYHIEVTL